MTPSMRMEEDRSHMTERILNLTLEIIYLLTGESFPPVKSGDQVTIKVPPPHSLLTKKTSIQKVLEATKKMMELLTGESDNPSGYNIIVKEEYQEEDEEYGVMKELSDGRDDRMEPPSRRNPPERCPRPLYSRDPTQEGLTIPHHDQGEDLMKMKVEGEVEETYVRDDQRYTEEAGMMRTSVEEDTPTGHAMEKPSKDRLTLSPGCKMEDEDITAECAGKETMSSAMDGGRHRVDGPWTPSDSEPPRPVGDGAGIRKTFSCPECGGSFTSEPSLTEHQQSHAGAKPNAGREKGSSRKSRLPGHEMSRASEMLSSCPDCGRCSEFCACQRPHAGEAPYSCSECGKGFSQKFHLNLHQKCHTLERPYGDAKSECFSRNSDLTEEEMYHSDGETSPKPKSSGKMSAVWLYYKINERNVRIADCNLCAAKISRGGSSGSNFNTTNLIKHLKIKHPIQHAEFTAVTIRNLQRAAPLKRTVLPRDDPKAIKITEAVAQFMVLDDRPLSVLDDVGFRRLLDVLEPRYKIPSHAYVTGVVLPHMRDAVKKRVAEMLREDIKAMSVTADLWRSGASPTPVMSLTAQWLDDGFAVRQVMLHAEKFQGSHAGQAASTARILEEALETWAIPRSSVHAVVRDRAAADDAGLPSIPCVAHTLQLAVSEGLLSQRSVAHAVGVGRRIVGHFEHSNLEFSWLQDIQLQLGQPVKRLRPDVESRWDSTFHMLRSLMEQKRAIGGYESQHELPVAVTGNVWNLVEKTLNILAPFEELARQLSSAEALASDVIPAVTVLQKMLSKEVNEERGTKSMKSALLAAFQKHFSDVERNPLYCLATLLDPRYKDRFFSHVDTGRRAKELLRVELDKVSEEAAAAEVLEEAAMKSADSGRVGTSLESVYHEIAAESTSESRAPTAATIQLEVYLGEVTAPRSDKPLRYWALHKRQFPALARVAQKYLSAPCSRMSSTASHLPADSGNRLLLGEHAETLLFLKKNLPLTFQK